MEITLIYWNGNGIEVERKISSDIVYVVCIGNGDGISEKDEPRGQKSTHDGYTILIIKWNGSVAE